MNILVCGGRDFTNERFLWNVMDTHNDHGGVTQLISGGARGADTLAANWARARNIRVNEVYAEWGKYGRSAGAIRNLRMLDILQACEGGKAVFAFPGGKGTANMVANAKKVGVEVKEFSPNY